MDTEVIVAGRGIAGLVVSLLLKRKGIPHLVLDRRTSRKQLALGETLPPSALPLLQSLGLLDLFENKTKKAAKDVESTDCRLGICQWVG